MKDLLTKIKDCKALKILKSGLASKYFPFVTAAVVLFDYYLGLDIVTIYYIGIAAALIIVLSDDISPLISVFLFMNVMISFKNSPSSTTGGSDYFMRQAIYGQIIFVIVLVVAAIIFRFVLTFKEKKFKLTPVFFGLCALAIVFILNGVFSSGYQAKNLLYGAVMAFGFLAVFAFIKDNLKCSEGSFVNVAYGFVALSALLIIELVVKFATTDNVISDGRIDRNYLMFGWGIYNTMGMLFLLCIPAIMFLAGRYKYGYLFFAYSIVVMIAMFLTMSRQAIVGAAVIFPLCTVILLVKGKNRIINSIITGILAVILITLLCVYWTKIIAMLGGISENPDGSNGRLGLWNAAIQNFKSAPVFGTGFYVDLAFDPGFVGLDFVPRMYHNTFMQLLGACGILGLAAYVVHRVQTVISFFKNVTIERTFIAITVLALLIVNLFDNHLFYILPTLVYSSMIAMLVKSEGLKKKAEATQDTEIIPEQKA